MSGMNKGKDVIGIARQYGLGQVALGPQFAHGIAGGGVKVDPNQEPDPLTSAYVSPAGAFRDKLENGAAYTARAWLKSVGLYLLAALGNISTAGPVETLYTHTITLGDSLPYFTVFEKKPDNTIVAVADCKIDELSLEWEENKPVVLGATFVGGGLSFPVTFTADVNELDSRDYFTPVGGSFKLDIEGSSPIETPVLKGKITIKRSAVAQFFSGDIEAGDVVEGMCDVDCALTIVPDDLDEWRTIITGTDSGASAATAPVYGSFEITFEHGTSSLEAAAASVGFLCDLPEGDPGGGAAEVELSGVCYRVSTTPITWTLINAQASYAPDPADS